ncbi:MAG: hypothetical protein F6J98_02115 [Moorea sp. SIO4G2]|nr:hypothetical protein [Moorena sp. SIO4G2]
MSTSTISSTEIDLLSMEESLKGAKSCFDHKKRDLTAYGHALYLVNGLLSHSPDDPDGLDFYEYYYDVISALLKESGMAITMEHLLPALQSRKISLCQKVCYILETILISSDRYEH